MVTETDAELSDPALHELARRVPVDPHRAESDQGPFHAYRLMPVIRTTSHGLPAPFPGAHGVQRHEPTSATSTTASARSAASSATHAGRSASRPGAGTGSARGSRTSTREGSGRCQESGATGVSSTDFAACSHRSYSRRRPFGDFHVHRSPPTRFISYGRIRSPVIDRDAVATQGMDPRAHTMAPGAYSEPIQPARDVGV